MSSETTSFYIRKHAKLVILSGIIIIFFENPTFFLEEREIGSSKVLYICLFVVLSP